MEEQIKPIVEENVNANKIDKKEIVLPDMKNVSNNSSNNDIIDTLPDWSIEPPLEINRGIE